MQQTTWRERFYEKFPNKIAEVIDDFGENTKNELHDFIESELSQQRKEIIEEIKHNFEDVICFTDKTNNAAYTSICFQGTSKGANLSDIITKLSSEEV